MNEVIVTCAGCGKRYKGVPGPKKFKCASCANVFTYPDGARAPSAGHVLCSNCWTESELSDALESCASCNQRISPKFGGKATPPASASSMNQAVGDDTGERKAVLETKYIQTNTAALEAKIQELQTQLTMSREGQGGAFKEREELYSKIDALRMKNAELQKQVQDLQTQAGAGSASAAEVDAVRAQLAATLQERDTAVATAEALEREKVEAIEQLEQFRQAAVATLEPLAGEFSAVMHEISTRAETLFSELRQAREEHLARLERLEFVANQLGAELHSAQRNFGQRLADIIGGPSQSEPEGAMPPADAPATESTATQASVQ